ncbi:unnamed protein product [Gadus morhua 'NCC']
MKALQAMKQAGTPRLSCRCRLTACARGSAPGMRQTKRSEPAESTAELAEEIARDEESFMLLALPITCTAASVMHRAGSQTT